MTTPQLNSSVPYFYMLLRELAKRLEMSPPAIGFSVERGEAVARENGYHLID